MGLLESLPFPPDEELRKFLEEYDATNGRMYQNRENILEPTQDGELPPMRPKYYGRKPSNSLSQARAECLMTQRTLADKVGTTKRAISRIENGHTAPSVYLAIAIAQALGTTVEDIFHLPHLTPIPPSSH